jgi:lysophospholipid acyltransferase (LPLAT)-like uncharacterized protein
MQDNYYTEAPEAKADTEMAVDRLKTIERLISTSSAGLPAEKHHGRNLWTRTLDWFFVTVRQYVPPLHWLGVRIAAFITFIYVRLVALTMRFITTGCFRWPNIAAPCVLAMWHGDAPSFLVAFAARRPASDLAIMISLDPRGDFLARLCRLLGFIVVRGGSSERGWEALIDLARKIEQGACVVITADGGGPARVVKVGALALASATHVPLVPLSANCHPAIVEPHKWDAARNPVPFAKVAVATGEPRTIEPLSNLEMIEQNTQCLQLALERLGIETRKFLRQSNQAE